MKDLMKRYLRLAIGFVIIAYGINSHIASNLGCSPWDVLATGLAKLTGWQNGTFTIIIGAVIILVDILCKEKIGIGTFLNMLIIGNIINFMANMGMVPHFDNVYLKFLQLFFGMLCQAYGTFLYMTSEFGAGPRDTFMVIVSRKMKKPIGTARLFIEICVVIVGTIIGGQFGIGTIFLAFSTGYTLQYIFKLHHMDAKKLQHRTLEDEITLIRNGFKMEV